MPSYFVLQSTLYLESDRLLLPNRFSSVSGSATRNQPGNRSWRRKEPCSCHPYTQQPIPVPQPDLQRNSPPIRPIHVAIISDGNGRWATSRGLPRSAGHRAGAQAARAVIEAAPRLGIHTLTLFALSSANWKRPPAEVTGILRILHEYLLTETSHCIDEGIRLSIIGRRDRIPATLRQAIVDSEAATAHGTRLHLRLAVDYSARNAIYNAACRFYKVTELSQESFSSVLAEVLRGGRPTSTS